MQMSAVLGLYPRSWRWIASNSYSTPGTRLLGLLLPIAIESPPADPGISSASADFEGNLVHLLEDVLPRHPCRDVTNVGTFYSPNSSVLCVWVLSLSLSLSMDSCYTEGTMMHVYNFISVWLLHCSAPDNNEGTRRVRDQNWKKSWYDKEEYENIELNDRSDRSESGINEMTADRIESVPTLSGTRTLIIIIINWIEPSCHGHMTAIRSE